MYYKIKNNNELQSIFTIYCVTRNYSEHAKELNNKIPDKPVVFIKSKSCIVQSAEKLVLADDSSEIHFEAELVLAIGSDIERVDEDKAEAAVFAYGLGIDYTNRTVQNDLKAKSLPWTTAKNFYGAAPISEFILKENVNDIYNESFYLSVNDKICQTGNIKDMIFTIPKIISYLSHQFPIKKGDLIFTGTPSGVAKVNRGDKLKVWMDLGIELSSEVV